MKYDPNKPVDTRKWMALPESERIDLVLDYHTRKKTQLPNERMHAAIHAAVENQIALGDELPVESKLNDLMEEGLDRHEAVHAIGSVLAEQIYGILSEGSERDDQNVAYLEAVEQLTAKSWIERYSE